MPYCTTAAFSAESFSPRLSWIVSIPNHNSLFPIP
jgi:hypothetical protein